MIVQILLNSVGYLVRGLPSERYNLRQINLHEQDRSYTYCATYAAPWSVGTSLQAGFCGSTKYAKGTYF